MLRVAQLADIPAIEQLIRESVEGLQAATYSGQQRALAMGRVYGTDRQMIRDGTYFVMEDAGVVQACGGWSWRRTAFGGDGGMAKDDTPLDPLTDAARIRAFFVHPGCAGRGLGTQLLLACENAARAAGFRRMQMTSTLAGIPFYTRHCYAALEALELPLEGKTVLPVMRMEKLF
jgi:N-acetylglutamate synthase-like GNAT family acetyltransferase